MLLLMLSSCSDPLSIFTGALLATEPLREVCLMRGRVAEIGVKTSGAGVGESRAPSVSGLLLFNVRGFGWVALGVSASSALRTEMRVSRLRRRSSGSSWRTLASSSDNLIPSLYSFSSSPSFETASRAATMS